MNPKYRLPYVFPVILACVSSLHGQIITNGNFEAGLAGWSHNLGVYYIGQAGSQPIGVDGNYAADIGGANVTGAMMWQTVPVLPLATYQLEFFSAANGGGVQGLIAVGKLEIVDSTGTTNISQSFTNVSPGTMFGTNGFGPRAFQFGFGVGVSNATITFKDITPGGGSGVDVAIDGVALQLLAVTNIVRGCSESLCNGFN